MQRYILAPNVDVRWKNEEWKINVSKGGNTHIIEDPESLMLLGIFSKGALSIEEALKKIKEKCPEKQARYVEAEINELRSLNIIVPYRLSHDEFFVLLNKKREGMKSLRYDDWGMTVSNCGKENLSPGCQACKDGRWICIFPSFVCNAECKFCPRLTDEMLQKAPMSAMSLDLILMNINQHSDLISGISVSGGEPLISGTIDITKKIVEQVRKKYSHIYLWAYTNGIAATEENMKELRDLGMDELRFNLASTDFDKGIIEKIEKYAVKIFPWVSVEVPIYSESYHHLIVKEKLKEITEIGVKQINLAEVRVPIPKSNDGKDISPAAKHFLSSEELYQFDCMSIKVLSLVNSRLLTYDILEYAYRHELDIRINDCSQEAKVVQILGRKIRGLGDISRDIDAFSEY